MVSKRQSSSGSKASGKKFEKQQNDPLYVKVNKLSSTKTQLPYDYYYLNYDHCIGIYRMDFFVVLDRAWYWVACRRRCNRHVRIRHRVTKDDAMKWFQMKYEGVIMNKSRNLGS